MKMLYLLLVVILCQSCYTYKTIDKDKAELTVGKRYKVKLKDECVKADLVAANDSIITMLQYNKDREIKRSDIREIKSRKFSIVKTVGYPVLIVGAIVGLFALAY